MHKFPKIRRPGHSSVNGLFTSDEHELIVTEKIDGNNVRFARDGDELVFGSRNQVLGTDPDEVGDMFVDVANYIDDRVDPDDIRQLETWWSQMFDHLDPADVTVTLFGENAIQHTIEEYDWEAMPQFQLFDIEVDVDVDDGNNREWLRWGHTEDEAERLRNHDSVLDEHELAFLTVEDVADWLGLETVPVCEWTTIGEFDPETFEVPESVFRTDDGPAEGVVLRNPVTGQKAKVISEAFAERHQSATSSSIPDTNDDTGAFLHTHVTERRIEKHAAKLLEEPDNGYDEFGMELMEDLHWAVWRDVWAEDYEEIIQTDWVLDMDRAHNATANKCASHCQTLLQAGNTPVSVVDPERGETVGPDQLTEDDGFGENDQLVEDDHVGEDDQPAADNQLSEDDHGAQDNQLADDNHGEGATNSA